MTGRLAVLCPGQGGQHAGMFDVLGDAAGAASLLDRWPLADAIQMPLATALDDNAALYSNRIAQPLIVAASLAVWERIKAVLPPPSLVLGYSVGEISAYAVAQALTPQAAVSLAAMRARLMDDCVQTAAPQALLAVTAPGLKTLLETAARSGLFVAIETGSDSAIVGGLKTEVLAFERQLHDGGVRTVLLPVNIASHTPLMNAALGPLRDVLLACRLADPAIPVVSGVEAAAVRRSGEAVYTLVRQLSETVRWTDCMDACAEAGITVALELGPGSALSRMLRERHPHIECRSVDDFRSVAGIAKWMQRAGLVAQDG